MNDDEDYWRVEPGQRLLDGEIRGVSAQSVTFVSDGGSTETRALFEQVPERAAPDPRYNGVPISLDLETDVATFVALLADLTGSDAVVADGLPRTIRVVARDAPWDGVLARSLAEVGLAFRAARGVVLVGSADLIESVPPPSPSKEPARPINLSFHHGDLRDIGRLFADISGLDVSLPEADCAVNVSLVERPWDEALGWIVSACGWTYHIDGGGIEIAVVSGDRISSKPR
jgi:type II secretory pathway component HofQ